MAMNKSFLRFGVGITGLAIVTLCSASCGSDGGGNDGGGGQGGSSGGHAGTTAGGSGGGSSGAGGAGGLTCPTTQYTHTSPFGSSFDGWGVPSGNPTYELIPMPGEDGGPPTGTIQSLDSTIGSPTPGSAKLEIPFSGVSQQLLFAQNFPSPLNLTGTTVTAQIRLDSGIIGNPVTSVVRAFIVIKSTAAYTYATGIATNLDASAGWVTLTIKADAPDARPSDYNPCDVREIDVEIDTGQLGTYTTGIVHIDTIAITAGAP